MSADDTQHYDDGNWTFMYVVLSLILVVFIAIAVYSVKRTKLIEPHDDLEMAMGHTSQQTWFPCEDAASERPGASAAADTGRTPTKPPVISPRFDGRGELKRGKNTGRRGGGMCVTRFDTDDERPRAFEYAKSEPSKIRRDTQDFQDIPL